MSLDGGEMRLGVENMKVTIRPTSEYGAEVLFDGKKIEQVLSFSIRFESGHRILHLEIDDPEIDISLKTEWDSRGFNQFEY